MSQKINAIVFSQDRAAQLKLFLDSAINNASGVFDLSVIISHTEDDYAEAYNIIFDDPTYKDVNFVFTSFEDGVEYRDHVLSLLKTNHKYSCFFLDDDIIYRKIKLTDIASQLESDEDVVCFSLRLGENVTTCYTLGAENVMHDIEKYDNFMKWDWTLHYLDFGYPFAMNGHVFRGKDIYKLTRKSKFTNVEELEMALFDYTESFPRNFMTSYKESALVNVPCGRVQVSLDDEMAMTLKNSESRVRRKSMNTLFLTGEFINLELIDFSNIEGCHQKMDFGNFTFEIKKSGGLDAIAIKKFGKMWDELTGEEQREINESLEKIEELMKQKEKND